MGLPLLFFAPDFGPDFGALVFGVDDLDAVALFALDFEAVAFFGAEACTVPA